MIVPNKFPTSWPSDKRIALIGEAPGKDEEKQGSPFVGYSGQHLGHLLSSARCPARHEVYMGNVSQHRPFNNEILRFAWNGPEITSGLKILKDEIQQLQPNIVVLLGNVPLKAARDPRSNHLLQPKLYRYKTSLWRGSLFICDEPTSPFYGFKCMATYHPAYLLRDYTSNPLAIFDLRRAREECSFPTLHLPSRSMLTNLTADEILARLGQIRTSRSLVALDIEGGLGDMSCISFAVSPYEAFIVPFYDRRGVYRWRDNPAGPRIWRALAELLEDPLVPKVLQNCLYDMFVLEYGYGIRVQGVRHDTMLSGWEIYSQLEKGLDVQTSIYTREPYYKNEMKAWDTESFYKYCCKDSCVTYEIKQEHDKIIDGKQLEHFQSNMANLEPMLAMELGGIRYDAAKAKDRHDNLKRQYWLIQGRLNRISGFRMEWKSKGEIFNRARELFGLQRKLHLIHNWGSLETNAKLGPKEYRFAPLIRRLQELLVEKNPDLATAAEVEDILDCGLNVDSDTFETYLYDHLQLPKIYNESDERDEQGNKKKVLTTDYEALLRLSKECITHPNKYGPYAGESVKLAIEIRALLRRAAMLEIHADPDGRVRCGYNIVGSYTGRVTSYTSPTGSGYNLQTIPNYTNTNEAPGRILGDRDLFLSDDGYWFFQCDLKGADGWTVAAYCAMLGDPTMLDDYRFGLKPHNIMALKLRGVQANYNDREELKYLCHPSRFDKEAWDVFACKRVFHGGNYLEGGGTIAKNILTDSEGKLWMTEMECNHLKRNFMFARYPGIERWHRHVQDKLSRCPLIPYLVAASGQLCYFFDRPRDILTQAVAFEPQANTTYATNQAMLKLWRDPANCQSESGTLVLPEYRLSRADVHSIRAKRIQPLHQVHDALCGQFRKEDTAWATGKIKSYFDTPLIIANQQITIPFDGAYGPAWGLLGEKHGGGII